MDGGPLTRTHAVELDRADPLAAHRDRFEFGDGTSPPTATSSKGWPRRTGWFSQADQFAMGPRYRPVAGIGRFLAGTSAARRPR